MKVVITGASGMIGSLVLTHCLNDEDVTQIIALNRRPLDISHPKYHEVIVKDFADLSDCAKQLCNVDVVYYCLGAYTGQLNRNDFHTVNVTYPNTLSQQLVALNNDNVRFCLLSGQGADRKEKSRMQFAKDKGEIENLLAKVHSEFYAFRPGYIYPVTPRKEPNFSYKLSRWVYPLLSKMGDKFSVKSTELAYAMYKVGLEGFKSNILENEDIVSRAQQ